MKVLVIGVGSIGSRHLANISALGHEAYAIDINEANLDKVALSAKKTFLSLDEALEEKPNVAFICTYSNDHIKPAMKCADAGCHLFIEKPLSMNAEGVDKLVRLCNSKNLITMVGCNMRFHPAISYMYKIIKDDIHFGDKLWGGLEFGYYLPFDKPDYTNCYKANKHMGGNLIFDGIHELDCAVWFFGVPKEVVCNKSILSSLKIDTEDHVEMIIKFRSGAVCTIHMDYLQHGYSRRYKIVCGDGTIVWDFSNGSVGIITTSDATWKWQDMKLEISYNQMYVDEVQYFLNCVSSSKQTFNSLEKSYSVLKLAIAAQKSCITNNWEKVK